MNIDKKDKEKLYKQLRHSLGAPIREIELLDEMLETLIEISVENYAQYVQEWLIEHQWQSLLGQQITSLDMSFALSTRNFDFVTQFSYAYSKQVGLQARGPWELKKDFIDIEAGRQVYVIPAGREVNEVLWMTPSTTDAALFANYGGFDTGFGGGFAQLGTGAGGGSNTMGGYHVSPAFDVLLTAADYNLKNRILRSELVYKLTAGPDGTRLLHLLSTPGSRLSFAGGATTAGTNRLGLSGCTVWYHYYETTPENVDACRKANSDIIKLPNEVPLEELEFSSFNPPTKTLIRQLFVAEAKITLGRVRGKFGGIVGFKDSERTMDFESLLSEGTKEKEEILKRLDERLLRLSTEKQLERAANEAESLNKSLTYRPNGFFIK